ncbi:MAG: helix-turn-helix domain-containing protein, partial [Pseudomonadota bacterium]
MQTTLNASTSAAVSSPAASRTQVRILAAAEELLRSGGAQALNMRALADAAGVSIATPYNVFGSKEAVLLAVMNNDLQAHQSAFARASRGDLTDLFAACRITIEHLTADPDYFRALLSALHHTGNQDLRLLFAGPRYLLWKGLLNR